MQTKANGNCFFESLLKQLNIATFTPENLRCLTAYLHAQDYVDHFDRVEREDGGIGDDIWRCLEGRRWGDEHDAFMLAKFWQVKISIYKFVRDKDTNAALSVTKCIEYGKSRTHLRLFFEEDHYFGLGKFVEANRMIWEHRYLYVLLLTALVVDKPHAADVVKKPPRVEMRRVAKMNRLKFYELAIVKRHKACEEMFDEIRPDFRKLRKICNSLFTQLRSIEHRGGFKPYDFKEEVRLLVLDV